MLRAELSLHEGIPIERYCWATIKRLLDHRAQRDDLRILVHVLPHSLAHDLAGRAELAARDLALSEFNERCAKRDRGVFLCHVEPIPNIGTSCKLAERLVRELKVGWATGWRGTI